MSISCRNLFSVLLCLSWVCGLVFVCPCYAFQKDLGSKIFLGQQLKDGDFRLSSANYVFTLNFFQLGNSRIRYLGITLNRSADTNEESFGRVLWVANPNKPIYDTSGVLMINSTTGTLNIIYSGGTIILSTPTSTGNLGAGNFTAELQNDGNLVLSHLAVDGSESILWQSFDYPTDTLLPGMKVGINLKTGHQWSVSSWLSDDLPSTGSFTLGMDRNNTSLIISLHTTIYWSSGHWQDDVFQNLKSQDNIGHWTSNFTFISNENEEYFRVGKLPHLGIYVAPDGYVRDLNDNILTNCDVQTQPLSIGCVNYSYPLCTESTNVFYRKEGVDTNKSLLTASVVDYSSSLAIGDCVDRCKHNCSCYACATLHKNQTGCSFWGKNEMKFPNSGAGDNLRSIYVRLISEEPRNQTSIFYAATRWWQRWWIWLTAAVCATLLLVFSILNHVCATYFIYTGTDDKGGEDDVHKDCSNKLSTSIMEAR